MGNVEQHLGNATPTTLLDYQLSDMWRSPRGTVLRIEGLALVAIACSFFLVAFGSCRRWSNRWIIQKGFLAAQALSLSLGTYSIGLMQSSSVKSEMYPIWAVSLLTLFGCVDPVTTYIGLEWKGPLLKMIFQLCLYCGYVLLLSVPTISGGVGKLAIGVLSAITFIKGFHMSLAFVQSSRTRDELENFYGSGDGGELQVHLPVRLYRREVQRVEDHVVDHVEEYNIKTSMTDIHSSCKEMLGNKLQLKEVTADGIEDVCLGYSLSHLLQQRFLGLDDPKEMELHIKEFKKFAGIDRAINYKRIFNAIEVELAFLYDVFFTSNEFLHYHEAKNYSFWAFASFVAICFVGVATAISGSMSSHHRITSNAPGAGIIFVNTRAVDQTITLVILVSLALLQLVQLIRCWTSNWALVAFACEHARKKGEWIQFQSGDPDLESSRKISSKEKQISWWVRLKVFVVTRMNWFDKYLWQDKLGQYSLVDEAVSSLRREWPRKCSSRMMACLECLASCMASSSCGGACLFWTYFRLPPMLGLQYIGQVLRELWTYDTSTAVMLHDDVKASMAEFLGEIKSRRIGVEWSSLFVDNGVGLEWLPYSGVPPNKSDAYLFSRRVTIWHFATCYCELADPQGQQGDAGGEGNRNRRVAMVLSRYYAHLAMSAPELLPGPSEETRRMHKKAASFLKYHCIYKRAGRTTTTLLEAMQQLSLEVMDDMMGVTMGAYCGMWLLNERPPPPGCSRRHHSYDGRWKLLALLWVQTLLYAAPYGDVQRHMQRLSQGGEFITHLWALLYHMGIDGWDAEPAQAAAGETRDAEAAAPAGETTEAAHVQGDLIAREAEIQEIV